MQSREEKIPAGKLSTIQYVILAIFLILGSRLWQLQIARSEEYDAKAENNRVRTVPILAPRGKIYDREGRLLETQRQIRPQPMPHRDERENKSRKGEPQHRPHERRAQSPHRGCAFDQGIDEFPSSGHGVSLDCRSRFRSDLMARCVATFKADTDLPLASAASFKDISLSLSRLMARR